MNHFRLYPLVKNVSRYLSKPSLYSRSSFNQGMTLKDKKGSVRRDIGIYHEIPVIEGVCEIKQFGLIKVRSSKSLCNYGREIKLDNNAESSYEILGCGMVLLKNYISLDDQVEIVNLCQDLGFKALGFDKRKEKLGVHMMLLGRKWFTSEYDTYKWSLQPLLVPDKIISLVNSSIQDSQLHLNLKHGYSSVCSKHSIVRFYENTGQIALHEEHDKVYWYPYVGKGWPAVSFFIGDSAEYFFSNSGNVNEADKVLLESGDAAKCSASTKSIRSGSHTDIGARRSNEDQHIHIDDVAKHLGDDVYKWANLPSSFYAVFDGHGGAEAASYVKEHAMRLFFESSDLPNATTLDGSVDELFLKELQDCHCKAFLQADQNLKEECSISDYCGTTALTVLVLGRHLLISNAGDCRVVISRKGVAKQMSNDHRPSNLLEKKRVEELGGYFEDGYLNGELAVTRALGDRCMKSESPLIAEPEMTQMVLTKDDEFMIIGCDGIWDVMSNEEAVSLVRKQLMQHNDPQRCATELINQALRLHTSDNLTAIVVCFSSHIEPPKPWRPRRGFRESAQ
ncbi:hypothetical protein CTI12_AA438750 [Artemisia annua]|uniref:protein-serine/threonine phosphatase n=1 Tax=Artemisia annua TaxID=35608 RepID=A0A2U1LYP6_ARTAN|nr:hypothetical protein CTI12_AA438750 [Artemisia annua]